MLQKPQKGQTFSYFFDRQKMLSVKIKFLSLAQINSTAKLSPPNSKLKSQNKPAALEAPAEMSKRCESEHPAFHI